MSRQEYEAVQAQARANARSRRGPSTPESPARTEYLYRSLLRCGACGLRMWGKTRPSGVYYQCQATHRRTSHLPPDHPPHVHLAEARFHSGVLAFLAEAVFGSDREEYWRRNLTLAQQHDHQASVSGRTAALTAEIADLSKRLERQVLALESEDATPALRRQVSQRIAELDEALRERRERLAHLAAEPPQELPRPDDVATMLAGLPVLADRLHELPQADLRTIFESLQLTVTYDPSAHEAEIGIVLRGDETPGAEENAQVWYVPPVGPGSVLRRLQRLIRRIALG